MPVERYFLDWDAPVTAKVREFLLPQQLSGPVDLGKDLIVVPTRQAGAAAAGGAGTALRRAENGATLTPGGDTTFLTAFQR